MKGPRAGGKTALIIDYALGNTGNLRLFPASLFIGHWTRVCPISKTPTNVGVSLLAFLYTFLDRTRTIFEHSKLNTVSCKSKNVQQFIFTRVI